VTLLEAVPVVDPTSSSGVYSLAWVVIALPLAGAAILLIGGNKTGENRWYEIHVPKADGIYDQYLEDLKKEGLL
jgi:hypothetical protein